MKKAVVFLLPILMLSCGNDENPKSPAAEKGLLKDQQIEVAGVDRAYHLFVPEDFVNAPLVLLFHGNGSNYDEILGLTGVKAPYKVWLDIAKRENLIIAVPNGTLGSGDTRGWNDCRNDAPANPFADDVLFISTLIDFIKGTYTSNASKVLAVGTSNGGHFSIRLAQDIPNKITAFAAVAASNPVNSKCANSTVKVSALFMNGTEDPILPYTGGQMPSNRGEVYSTDNTVTYWRQRNATDATPEITDLADLDKTDNSTVTKYLYKNGGDMTEVALYRVNDGGHTEPSLAQRYSPIYLRIVGRQNGDIEMADEIWDFFKSKSK